MRRFGKSSVEAYNRLWHDIFNHDELTDIKLAEGTIYGSRYYTAEPIGGNWFEMEIWCREIFGNDTSPIWGADKAPEPEQRWYMNNRKFWFREEKDRMMFVLKWR